MNRKSRKASRLRMCSRLRGRREGPSVLYDEKVPPRALAFNRAAKRSFKKSGLDHTAVPMQPITKLGQDPSGKPVYAMGRSRFVPPYLWRREKAKKPKEKT